MSRKQKVIGAAFGPVARELVRIGFTVWAVLIGIKYAPKTAAECVSEVFGVKTNSTQVFAVIVLLAVGLGAALLMRGVEAWRKRGS